MPNNRNEFRGGVHEFSHMNLLCLCCAGFKSPALQPQIIVLNIENQPFNEPFIGCLNGLGIYLPVVERWSGRGNHGLAITISCAHQWPIHAVQHLEKES